MGTVLCIVGCFSGIPSLYPVGASNTHSVLTTKIFPDIAKSSLEEENNPVENLWAEEECKVTLDCCVCSPGFWVFTFFKIILLEWWD